MIMPQKKYLMTLVLLAFAVGEGSRQSAAAAEKSFVGYCLESYLATDVCPEKVCEIKCATGQDAENCTKGCLPKECPRISAADCPLDYCAVMTDCSDEKICQYQMQGEKPQCGDLAYAGQDVECCDGFVKRCGVEFLDGRCDLEGKNSVYNLPICIPCGDGVCGQFEDRCNCPEDCQRKFKEPAELKNTLEKNTAFSAGNDREPSLQHKVPQPAEFPAPKIIEFAPQKTPKSIVQDGAN